MTAPYKGAFKPPYPRPVVDTVKHMFIRGDSYMEIANEIRRKHKLPGFTKNNVAGMVSRLRKRREIDAPERKGGHRPVKCNSAFDARPPAPITLPPIPPRRFT